jgi:hypothetical protein
VTYADPVFPFPSPTFLWVYDLIVNHQTGASTTTDDNGKWTYIQEASVGFTGYVGAANPREVEKAATRGVVIDAVALAPNGTVVDEGDNLTVPEDPAIPVVFWGRYDIIGVRPNASHTRVLLTRIQGEDPQHAP